MSLGLGVDAAAQVFFMKPLLVGACSIILVLWVMPQSFGLARIKVRLS